MASYLFLLQSGQGREISEGQCAFISLPPHLLLQVSRAAEPFATTIPPAFGRLPWQGFAFVCKPPKMNLDYQRSKVHILGQLNCWQVCGGRVWSVFSFVLLCWFSAFVLLDLDS